ENQQADDFAVLNADDPNCVALAERIRARICWFSRKKEVQPGASVRDGRIGFRDAEGKRREIMLVSEIPLKGAHNLENVLAAICAAAEKIESHIKGAAEIVPAETLDDAVHRAAAVAQAGDVVLLAPACASFDQFDNYEHRGRVFKEVVHTLAEQARRANC